MIKIKTYIGRRGKIPTKGTKHSACYDLYASANARLMPHTVTLVQTGIHIVIPEGFEGRIRSRSGLALNNNILVANADATIDSDYRGEIGVLLLNLRDTETLIEVGDRIAQFCIQKITPFEFECYEYDPEYTELPKTERNDGGFGSTGAK